RRRNARGDRGAGFVRDQRYVLARLHREARFHGVSRARHQLQLWRTESHIHYFNGLDQVLPPLVQILASEKAADEKAFASVRGGRRGRPGPGRRRWLRSRGRWRSSASENRTAFRGKDRAQSPPAC